MHPQITVAIPSLPARGQMLIRALRSVGRQTLAPAAVSVALDVTGAGAAATRQRALDAVQTEWVALLDDDDAFKAEHLAKLYAFAIDSGADYVYSWFDMVGGIDPFPPGHSTREFDPADPIETTITVLVRTGLAKSVGYAPLDRGHNANSGEDYGFLLGCIAAGGIIRNMNAGRSPAQVEKTWYYNVHGDGGKTHGNTSGLPTKGDALLWTPVSEGL